MSRSGIVNVRMVITEEKILSNIDKIQKMINPNSKKQIVQLDEDSYFKDLIDSIKSYLIEYPKKKNFPKAVYNAAYDLVENATNQFEENTKKIEELIRQREANISLAGNLKELIQSAKSKQKGWREKVKEAEEELPEELIESLNILGKSKTVKSESYQDALKLLNARVNNLESNLHIEIDMERIEDRSKALSYIGIEVADALKVIPTPVEEKEEEIVQEIVEEEIVAKPKRKAVKAQKQQIEEYTQATTFEVKPSLWEKFKNSKLVKAVTYVFKIRIRIELPNALPEGRGENY